MKYLQFVNYFIFDEFRKKMYILNACKKNLHIYFEYFIVL